MPAKRTEKMTRVGVSVPLELAERHKAALPRIMREPGKKNLISKRVEKMMRDDLEEVSSS